MSLNLSVVKLSGGAGIGFIIAREWHILEDNKERIDFFQYARLFTDISF
jgi:hypothetical protein